MATAKKAPIAAEAEKNTAAPVAKKKAPTPAAKTVAAKADPKAKPVAKVPVKTAPAAPVAAAPAETVKAKKPKLVRDGFTIPKAEYLVLDALKLRAADLKHPTKKSELLRAGIKALAAMDGAALLLALRAVPPIKTGRPSKA